LNQHFGAQYVAAANVVTALGEVERSQAAVADANALLETAKGFAEHAAGKRKRTEALKWQLEAESEQQAKQEKLIDAASPFGAPFDYSCDYRSLLEGVASPAVACDSHRPPPPEPDAAKLLAEHQTLASPEEPQGNITAPAEILPALGAEPSSMIEAAEAAPGVLRSQEVPREPPPPYTVGGASLQAADQKSIDVDQPYNDAAGNACRPIWQLLSLGQASMAFHAASWIGDESPGVTIPSPDLLAAVALEGALMLPDGGVQSALSARFERLQPEVFAAQTPRAWRTAINLLLASATMRAMILAPGTGAGSVAAYLHQDGNYPALYALVQQLRELSPLLMGFRIEPAVLRQARSEASIRADLQALQHAAEDWLRVQAPAYTIKFAAATSVWRHWLHAGGEIDALVTPVLHNRITEVDRVRERLAAMSDHAQVVRLIQDTDRKTLKRRRGEDIHAGALDHLLRNIEEALRLPRQWLNLVELLGQEGRPSRTSSCKPA
jgi:hypothetical protein